MKIDTNWLRNFILNTVKPLMSGKAVSQDADNVTMDNLATTGDSRKFRLTAPFGFVSSIPAGVTGFYQALFGSGHESILLAFIHKLRPTPSAPGETILYSTSADGATIKVKITLKNDGSIVIDAPTTVIINAGTDATINAVNATVNASTKAKVDSPSIELGGSALEKIVNGETFKTFFDAHEHPGNLGYPTGAPYTPMPTNCLSSTVKAKT